MNWSRTHESHRFAPQFSSRRRARIARRRIRRPLLRSGAGEPPPRAGSAAPAIEYRVLGKTGLKVTTVGFGCMITSDGSVIERAADMGITYFDTARVYQNGNNERMVGAALKNRRKNTESRLVWKKVWPMQI